MRGRVGRTFSTSSGATLENIPVKSDRSAHEGNLSDLKENAWSRFWFTPNPLTGLHTLRVLAGVLFCSWLLSFAGQERAFFSVKDGWFDDLAYREAQQKNIPMGAPLGWSILYLAETSTAFKTLYWGSIAILALFTLGVATRVTSVM